MSKSETTFHYFWGVKSIFKLVGWNVPPHATHWLATCWSGAAAYWSDLYLFKQKQKLDLTLKEEINRLTDCQLCWLVSNWTSDSAYKFCSPEEWKPLSCHLAGILVPLDRLCKKEDTDSTSKKTPHFLALNAETGFLKFKAWDYHIKCSRSLGDCAGSLDESISNPMDEWAIKTPNPICRLFFKIDLLTEFAALCLTNFIDWRYIHSVVGIFDPAC